MSAPVTQNSILLESILRFYAVGENQETFIALVTGKSNISLRVIDWFTTNYAKKEYTIYMVPTPNRPGEFTRFKVYDEYKLNLAAYSKARFDPFCRYDRIFMPCHDGKQIETTLGQLHFLKWCIEKRIIDYIAENFDKIHSDMMKNGSTSKKRQKSTAGGGGGEGGKTRKKREELSISATKSIKKEDVEIVVSFR